MPGRLDSKVAIVTDAGCVGPGWGNGRGRRCFRPRRRTDVRDRPRGDAMAETMARAQEVRHRCRQVSIVERGCLARLGGTRTSPGWLQRVRGERTSLALGIRTGKGAKHKTKWTFDGL